MTGLKFLLRFLHILQFSQGRPSRHCAVVGRRCLVVASPCSCRAYLVPFMNAGKPVGLQSAGNTSNVCVLQLTQLAGRLLLA